MIVVLDAVAAAWKAVTGAAGVVVSSPYLVLPFLYAGLRLIGGGRLLSLIRALRHGRRAAGW